MPPPYRIHHAGDRALVVEFGDRIDLALNARVLSLSVRLDALGLPGVFETVPTFRSAMVYYDPLVCPADELISTIESLLLDDRTEATKGRLWRIPVCYDPRVAEDLEFLVEEIGTTYRRLIELHSTRVYSVYMLGFLPGQPYLGDLSAELQLPRRNNPRMKIPAGSIGIATSLTCIFPMETPCGWHLIGRTPVKLWTRETDHRPLLAPGDQVLFEPISFQKFEDISSDSLPTLLSELSEATA